MIRDDAGRAVCGEFFRERVVEGKGPRGGRATFLSLVCTQCGRKTEAVKTARPGSFDSDQSTALRLKLHEHVCPSPWIEDAHSRLLREVATLATRGERFPLRLAVEYLADGRGLDVAVCHAWRHAEDGDAMASFVAAMRPDGPRAFLNYADPQDDGTTRVSIDVAGLHSSFAGARPAVARALRGVVDPRWVERFARAACDRLIPTDRAAGGTP
jgi:hypothetical protein